MQLSRVELNSIGNQSIELKKNQLFSGSLPGEVSYQTRNMEDNVTAKARVQKYRADLREV